jgi:hypothetical protein
LTALQPFFQVAAKFLEIRKALVSMLKEIGITPVICRVSHRLSFHIIAWDVRFCFSCSMLEWWYSFLLYQTL